MNTTSDKKRSYENSPPSPMPPKRIKIEVKTENDEESDTETVILSRPQRKTTENNLEKLKTENAQLRTSLYHLENIVLPGKNMEVEKLLQKLTSNQTEIDKVNLERESREEEFSDVVRKLRGLEQALKTAEEKNKYLSSSFNEQLCEIKKLHKLEVEDLDAKLAGKNFQLGEVTKMCSDLRLQVTTRVENHKKDMLSADAQLQQKEAELAKAKKEIEDVLAQWEETIRKLDDEKNAIREQAQKEALELVGVNLEHQKEIHELRFRLEELETGKSNPLDSEAQPIEEMVITLDPMIKIDCDDDVSIDVDMENMEAPFSQDLIPNQLVANKPFRCDICLKFFSSKHSLQTHQDGVHSTGPAEVYQCPFCGLQRKYRQDFQAHFKSKQTKHCLEKRPADFNYSLMVLDDCKITLEANE